MTERYDPKAFESRWQKQWEDDKLYKARVDWTRPKHYALTMLPYPSGDLHIGHWFAMTPSDARARYMRMKGFNVLFPMGFDAFGLPAENAAVQRNIHPAKWTYANIQRMRGQLRSMGAMFDWDREAVSCDPDYYKWTEWFFKQFYEHDLAYRGEALVNWSPTLQTVLANEQVIDGKDERTGQPVIQKMMTQWFFRYTAYADEMLDFSAIDWPEPIKIMETNWIGRSEGAHVTFTTEQGDPIQIYTTRPDTLWGATFMVLAPEHKLVQKITTDAQRTAVEAYVESAASATEIERTSEDRDKTGVFTGGYATNPVNGERIPIWIADYVLITYGTGAIMAVPAHDERDFAFALKFGLPIIPVIARNDGAARSFTWEGKWVKAGFRAALDAAGIRYETNEQQQVFVSLTVDQADAYIAIVQQYLQPGSWTEVVGSRWAFVFADAVLTLDSVESDHQIMERCRALEPSVQDKHTVMEMLSGQPWYQDVLFHADYGTMIHSGAFSGTPGTQTDESGNRVLVAKPTVINWLDEQGIGRKAINYRLRDWLISRQRYWGSPIPIIHRADGTMETVPDDQLPVLLPEDVDFMPTGRSPLTYYEPFLNTVDSDGNPAKRETDTMDTFMCSSWYWYRYLSPHYQQAPFDPEEAAYWLPVDTYTGGAEHATMHLLYSRWFAKAMRDLGMFDDAMEIMDEHGRDPEILLKGEPMLQLRNQGQVLGAERKGDIIVVKASWVSSAGHKSTVSVSWAGDPNNAPKQIVNQIEVFSAESLDEALAQAEAGDIVGELVKRTELTLHIQDINGEIHYVTLSPKAKINIRDIPGENNVNQLKHHLEIQRMSKSKGNVVNPDELVQEYGSDTVRAYLMFAFDWQKGGPWDPDGIKGPQRWLNEVWDLVVAGPQTAPGDAETERVIERKLHQAIARVTESLEKFSFNTAIAALMELKNEVRPAARDGKIGDAVWNETVRTMLILMAPFTPHIAEELWARTGGAYSIHNQAWPVFDADKAKEDTTVLVVQAGKKVVDRIDVPADIAEEAAIRIALEGSGAQRALNGGQPRKVIFIPGRGGQEPKVNIVL